MGNAWFSRSPTAKVRKKGLGGAMPVSSRRAPGLATFTDSAFGLAGADYRERLNSLSLTHMLRFYGWLLQERELACICLGRRKIFPIKRILVVILSELYICR